MSSKPNEKLITTSEVAALLGCGVGRVRQLARAGRLPVAAIVGRSMRLYDRERVEQLARERAEARSGAAA